MDEHILIKFKRGAKVLPVTGVRTSRPEPQENGIVLSGETSAFPRGFDLGLYPDHITKHRFKAVQRRLDWLSPSRFEVEIGRDNGQLRIEGVDEDALPAGRYTLKIHVDGLDLKGSQRFIHIPDKGKNKGRAEVTFEAKKEKLKLKLNRGVNEFDVNSRRILNNGKSKLDGLPAAEWLTADNGQDRRKAALLNIFAKLNAIPVARKAESLSHFVKHVFHAEVNRIYCAVQPKFIEIIDEAFDHDAAVHSTHARLLSRMPATQAAREKLKDTHDLESYREKVATSLQVVVAKPKQGSPDTLYVDLDIDKSNPNYDAYRFILHVGDVISSKKTNHLKLRSKLVGGDTGDFLYYDVVKA
jgi:hypothetical protein